MIPEMFCEYLLVPVIGLDFKYVRKSDFYWYGLCSFALGYMWGVPAEPHSLFYSKRELHVVGWL